jgi:hypothetical protein
MRVMSHLVPPLIALLLAMTAINSADVIRKWWTGDRCEQETFTVAPFQSMFPPE